MKSFSGLAIASLSLLLTPIALQCQQANPARSTAQAKASLQVTQCALRVSGMTCEGCAGVVENGLLKLDGVKAAKVDFKTGAAEVQYDPKKTTPEKLVAAFNDNKLSFRVKLAKAKSESERKSSKLHFL